jgi:RecA/RadA recombinase
MYEEKTVTVGQLRELYTSGKYDIQIDTPDGFQQVTNWFDKGPLETVKVETATGMSTVCAVNHLLEIVVGNTLHWLPAAEVTAGMKVLTHTGVHEVTNVEPVGIYECYDFTVDHPNHRYYGDGFSSHNSGKSYVCSGNLVKDAQRQGIFVVIIDSENALDETWLHNLGVDTSPEKLLKLNMAMIDDVAKTISEFVKDYRDVPEDERPKVLFVIDSLGMLMTPTDQDQFSRGDLKGDMGRKPKALNALVRNCVNMIGDLDIGIVATNHTYASQDQYNPDQIISGGQGTIFAASIVVAMKKLKLKEDEDGDKTTTVNGIRSGCNVQKTRYAKPFESIEVQIPFNTGMTPTSGLFDLLERRQLITKEGNRYCYTDLSGEIHKYFRKEWNRNTDGIFDLVMKEFPEKEAILDALKAKENAEVDTVEDTTEGLVDDTPSA